MPTLQEVLAQRRRRAASGVAPTVIVESDVLRETVKELAPDILEAFRPLIVDRIREHFNEIKPSLKGDKGVDAKVDLNALAQKAAALIPKPEDGEDGDDGNDADEELIAQKVLSTVLANLPAVENGKPGADAVLDHDQVAQKVVDLIKEKQMINMDHIDGIGKQMERYWRNVMAKSKSPVIGGGGDTVVAGTGITITKDGNGRSTISSLSAPGTAVYEEIPSDSGNHINFTLAHTPIAGTFRLYRGGNRQQSGVSKDYTISGSTLTLTNALTTGELLICDYEY